MTQSAISRQAEGAAEHVLSSLGITELSHMPVDATKVAEMWGIDVFADDLDAENLDGFVLISPRGAEMTINQNSSQNRRRFTCAHELGHVEHARLSPQPKQVGFIDDVKSVDEQQFKYRDETSRQGTSREEVWANAFAAALLMPKGLVRILHEASVPVQQMARFFKVSQDAMSYRLENLGFRE